MTDSVPSTRPRRRYDPGRRERLIDAALDVIAESGIAGDNAPPGSLGCRRAAGLDPATTRALDALIEGLVLHNALSQPPRPPRRSAPPCTG